MVDNNSSAIGVADIIEETLGILRLTRTLYVHWIRYLTH